MLFVEHDTTAAMMGLSITTLLTSPEKRAELRSTPDKTGLVTEELRHLPIVQFGLGRVVLEDLEIGKAQIRKGDLAVVAMPLANRCPRVLIDPDTPDFDRKLTRHLAFGYGVHQCLGRASRAELKTVIPGSSNGSRICDWPFRRTGPDGHSRHQLRGAGATRDLVNPPHPRKDSRTAVDGGHHA